MPSPELEEEFEEVAAAGEESPERELTDELHDALQDLQGRLSGVLGSALVDREGFPLAWDLKGGADPHLTATAAGMITQATRRVLRTLDFGTMRNTVLTTTKGSIAVFRVTRDAALILLLQPSTNNILVLIEANRTIERLRKAMRAAFE